MDFPEISCSEGPVEKSEDVSCNDSDDGGIRLIRCTRYVDSLSAAEPGQYSYLMRLSFFVSRYFFDLFSI